jgi:hypothetical protein
MNPRVKDAWVNALSNYKQTTGCLRDETGFCCLGVLCDLYSKETGIPWTAISMVQSNQEYCEYEFCGERDILPYKVLEWAGLKSADPEVEYPNDHEYSEHWYNNLSTINDIGLTFKQISCLIKDSL